jgi:S1/P1 nuclease
VKYSWRRCTRGAAEAGDCCSARRYQQTRQWHYVDLELSSPNLDRACFAHPALPPGTPATAGPAEDCVVDKIDQFEAQLSNPHTSTDERRLALQFLLHLVGDVHQPLHASDDADEGGNLKRVSARGLHAASLHHYWDTEPVLMPPPAPSRRRLPAATPADGALRRRDCFKMACMNLAALS